MTTPIIPDYWTAREALAVYEFIDELREVIWSRYGLQLQELMQEDRVTVFDVDEDVTF